MDGNERDDAARGQVNRSSAEVYEEFFVPALFRGWVERVADAASVGPGDRVLDVACGTGVLARHAAERTGPEGAVVGLDVNEGMLAVAGRVAPSLEWRTGRAEALPFEDDSFDVVVSQFALMFFEEPEAALREMVRVLRPGGRLAIAVWGSLDDTPGYRSMVALLRREFGDDSADALTAPYSLGDVGRLRDLLGRAGLRRAEITTLRGEAHFASLSDWVFTDIHGWTLAGMLDDEQYRRLLEVATAELAPFVTDSAHVVFDTPAHIVTAVNPR
jgi:SAM-dependent methyltransferase